MLLQENETASQSALGKKTAYNPHYDPNALFAISRKNKREEIGILSEVLPFYGFDYWNHYEVSWLNDKGKPIVALAEIIYDCNSPNIIESKSMKLYFNSLNNTTFLNVEQAQATIKKDLERYLQSSVLVNIIPCATLKNQTLYYAFEGVCLDALDVTCTTYTVEPSYLQVTDEEVKETVYSDLLKSNCLVTNQPDWGSVQITYTGKKIDHAGLLRYLVSFRNHNEFHEQCIERIFVDIMQYCRPCQLTVHGRYTRRGGLDINPYRSTEKVTSMDVNRRLCRQ